MTPDLPPELLVPGRVVSVAGPGGATFAARVSAEPPGRLARLPRFKRVGLVVVPLLLAGGLWGGAAHFFHEIRVGLAPEVAAAPHAPADGAALYAARCASCHGRDGKGDGVAELTTRARYYGYEPFKFTDTAGTRVPTDAHLVALLKRGIPGSSMPSFAELRDDQLEALVRHVRALTRRGKYEALFAKAVKDFDDGGDDPNPVAIHHKADLACEVGTPPPAPTGLEPATPRSLHAGRAVYERVCQSCHGPSGAGDGPQVAQLRNDNGTPARPRNLTGGVFKGGGDKVDIFYRVHLGIPGTPMPATPTLTPREMGDLVNYVRSLSSGPAEVARR